MACLLEKKSVPGRSPVSKSCFAMLWTAQDGHCLVAAGKAEAELCMGQLVRGVLRAQPKGQVCKQKAHLANRPAHQMQSKRSGTPSSGAPGDARQSPAAARVSTLTDATEMPMIVLRMQGARIRNLNVDES